MVTPNILRGVLSLGVIAGGGDGTWDKGVIEVAEFIKLGCFVRLRRKILRLEPQSYLRATIRNA